MRVRICDLRTGRRILDLPYLKADWTGEFNGAETVTATVSVNDRRIQKLDLYNASIPGRTALIIGRIRYTERPGDFGCGYAAITLGVSRLPYSGGSTSADAVLAQRAVHSAGILGAEHAADGTANTGFDTNIKNTSYQTIAKRWIQQSLTWTGGNLPITFEDDMAGTYERNIKGAELKLIGDLLINLTEVQNGPDIRFQPRLTTDGLGYEWLLKTGKPRLTGNTTTIWDTSLPGNTVSDLTISQDANDLANIVWETGGAASDQAIIERATDHSFTGLGFPLLEKVESLSSSVTDPKTALAHAVETIRTSTRPLNTWQFSVQRDQRLGEYDVGHDCGLIIRNDQFGIPDGLHKLRIMTLRGSSDSDKIEITTGAFNE